MYDWFYESDPEWLATRRFYLGASDVVSLLPELKRIRKSGMRKIKLKDDREGEYSLACAQLWAEKNSQIEDSLTAPSNEAARGHILEPYAIDEFNRISGCVMHHWDDIMIVTADGLGYSPDGLSIAQPVQDPGALKADWFDDDHKVEKMVECKAYSVRHHTEKLFEDKMDAKERYQVATAMTVLPTISVGAVIYYNPISPQPLIINTYKRDELTEELLDVSDILGMYNTTIETIKDIDNFFPAYWTEAEIYQRHCEEREKGVLSFVFEEQG